MNPDFLIIGSGISGLLTARELANSGASITIIDKGPLSSESSWAGGGILSPLYPWNYDDAVTRLSLWSQQQYPALAGELFDKTGIDPELLPCGLLIGDQFDNAAALNWLTHYNIERQFLSPEETNKIAPNLVLSESRLLWMPGIHQGRNPRLLSALRAELKNEGVKFVEHQEASRLEVSGNNVSSLLTASGKVAAANYIICAGAWSSSLWPEPNQLPVEPVKGQMILFKAEPEILTTMLLDRNRYLIPRRDGRILVGSTVEHCGFDKSTSADALNELKNYALERLPALANYPIEKQWAGLRPGTVDGVPFIGKHPNIKNLSVNCGHFRNGFVLGPASARLLADLILEREPIVPPTPYAIKS